MKKASITTCKSLIPLTGDNIIDLFFFFAPLNFVIKKSESFNQFDALQVFFKFSRFQIKVYVEFTPLYYSFCNKFQHLYRGLQYPMLSDFFNPYSFHCIHMLIRISSLTFTQKCHVCPAFFLKTFSLAFFPFFFSWMPSSKHSYGSPLISTPIFFSSLWLLCHHI